MKLLNVTCVQVISMVATFAAVTMVGFYAGWQIKSSADFTVAGTLIGGSSTIGTAQLAFAYGFSA